MLYLKSVNLIFAEELSSPSVETVEQSGQLDVEIISEELLGVHSDATPALLCHKEPAQGTQSPLLGRGFLAFCWFFMA